MEFKADLWQVIVTIVGLVVWFTRLEAKTTRNETDIDRLSKKHDALESELIKDLSEVKQSLARIEGQIVGGKK